MNTASEWSVLVFYSDWDEESRFDGIGSLEEAKILAAERMISGPTATDALVIDSADKIWERLVRR